MIIEISDNPELQTQLVAQMGQGVTAGNLEVPKLSDVASFRAQSASEKGDARGGAITDEFGNSQNTVAQPEIHNSGNAQQTDRSGHNVPAQQADGDKDKAEAAGPDEALDQASADKSAAESEKQEKISALTARIQQLQQQLSSIDVQISTLSTSQSGSPEETSPAKMGQLTSERSMLSSMIQSLTQQVASVQSE